MRRNIDSTAWLANTSTVKGNVTIGERSSIWFGSTVRAEVSSITIGKFTNVQDNCVIHTDPEHGVIIGDGVTIGHSCTIHGCRIDNNTLIGMGTVILNGAHIGCNCLIGAKSLITENSIIPDGSLAFGCPAKVQRRLSTEEIQNIQINSTHYVKIAQQYQNGDFD